ncbi:MAG: lytic murein transglycosylase B [Gammaproteobacteria bacterium]|nr:lytic murein transglycosylase B [Gammaproteobacteria bacterium]
MKYLLVLGLLFSTIVNAVEVKRGDYRDRADVAAFIVQMASRSDYSEQELVELFSTVSKQDHLFELLNKPAEKELQWYQYRPIFIKEKRIDLGVKFWREHQQLLSEVSTKTGVPEQIIIAVIGVETFYGIYKGKDPVLDSLVTLAFDYPKRGEFFTRELEQFLLLVKEQNLDPVGLLGSYAGAMGMPQFISSSYRSYAVDFDGDGQANLFDSVADITASVANYFVKHGWRANEAVAGPLTALEINTIERLEPGVKPVYKWSDLAQNGLQSNTELDPDTAVALVKLEQRNQPEYWAGLQNFYVITRYNHSELYAMAVYQLSLLIKARMERG